MPWDWNQPFESKPYDYVPKWERDVDYNPDHHPSFSRIITSVVGEQPSDVYETGRSPSRVIRVYQVRGLGVLIQEAFKVPSEDGKLVFEGLALLTKDDLGYCPKV